MASVVCSFVEGRSLRRVTVTHEDGERLVRIEAESSRGTRVWTTGDKRLKVAVRQDYSGPDGARAFVRVIMRCLTAGRRKWMNARAAEVV